MAGKKKQPQQLADFDYEAFKKSTQTVKNGQDYDN